MSEKVEKFDPEKYKVSLDKLSDELKEEQDKFATGEDELIVEGQAVVRKKDLIVYQDKLDSMKKQYTKIFGSIFRFLNPLLRNWKIDPLTNDEIENLGNAVLDLTEGKIKTTVKKIEKRWESLTKMTKFIDFFSVLWEIIVPRYNQAKTSIAEVRAANVGKG